MRLYTSFVVYEGLVLIAHRKYISIFQLSNTSIAGKCSHSLIHTIHCVLLYLMQRQKIRISPNLARNSKAVCGSAITLCSLTPSRTRKISK